MAFQKLWDNAGPVSLTATPVQNGLTATITITDTGGFKADGRCVLTANDQPNVELTILRVLSTTQLQCGPFPQGQTSPYANPYVSGLPNLSNYSVANSAQLQFPQQPKYKLAFEDIIAACYEAEGTVAIRNYLVDIHGVPYSSSNPIPTAAEFTGTVNVGQMDGSAFVYGTGTEMPVGGVYNPTGASLSIGETGAFQITQYRGLHVNLRNSSGTEITSITQGSEVGIVTSKLGKNAVQFAVNSYSSNNVTTSAYYHIISSTSSAANEIEIFDTSGSTLYLAFGAPSSEVNQILIPPGGNGRIALYIPSGTNISIKAYDVTASTGEFIINLYS